VAFAGATGDAEFFAKLARLGEIGDGVTEGDPELGAVAEVLAAALYAPSTTEEFKRRLVKMWVEERRLVSDEVALKAEEFDKALSEKLREAERRVVLEVKRGLVIDARGMKLSGLAGYVASTLARLKSKAVVVVFAPSEQTVVATCRVPRGVDFDALSELEPIALELGGGGGGHPRAAALRVPYASGDVFLTKICEVVRKRLE